MGDRKLGSELQRIDTKEFQLPETMFIRDIDNKVFHGIILQCLSKIDGIGLLEGNFLDHILGRLDGVKGLQTDQDIKTHCIKVKIEVNIAYGVSIPEKAEEIQTRISEELTRFTGLHVAEVHVVFRALIPTEGQKQKASSTMTSMQTSPTQLGEEYSDIF